MGVFNPFLYFPGDPQGTYVNYDKTDVALAYGSTVLGQWLPGTPLTNGEKYTLSVEAAGRINSYAGATFALAFVAGNPNSVNLADNITLGTSGAFTPTQGTFNTAQFAFTYTAANYDPKYSVLGINILALGTAIPNQILFDKVGLDGSTAAVPEPMTLLFLGCGLVGVAVIRRRIKK